MKQATAVKVMAYFALSGILISIVGTGILVIYETYINPSSTVDSQNQVLTQEELQKLLQKSATGAEQSSVDVPESLSGTTQDLSWKILPESQSWELEVNPNTSKSGAEMTQSGEALPSNK